MRHVRTYADELIQTPNRVAWVNDHAFVFSNDHGAKVGFVRHSSVSPSFTNRSINNLSSDAISIPPSEAEVLGTAPGKNAISLPHPTSSTSPTVLSATATVSSTSLAP